MTEDSKAHRYTYRTAGVDIDAGHKLVRNIKPLAAKTIRSGADVSLDGFSGLFDLKATDYNDPLLFAATDGVGTKLKVAFATGIHRSVGIDLVAMCVNDLVVQGAEPLFFLDYFATAKLAPDIAESVIAGIVEGCERAGCSLIGGETAEMPEFYGAGEYDLAGFAVGAVERKHVLPRGQVEEEDILLGIESSGVHSNGFSLIRRLIADKGLNFDDSAPFDTSRTLGTALLEPTRIYVKSMVAAIRAEKVKAICHVTGGGLTDNVPRMLPKGAVAEIDLSAWQLPPVFSWLDEIGNLGQSELLRTFNCGIGLVVVAPKEEVPILKKSFQEAGETAIEIGHVILLPDTDTAPEIRYIGRLSPQT